MPPVIQRNAQPVPGSMRKKNPSAVPALTSNTIRSLSCGRLWRSAKLCADFSTFMVKFCFLLAENLSQVLPRPVSMRVRSTFEKLRTSKSCLVPAVPG